MEIKTQNHKQNQKLDGIGVGRIKMFPFSSDFANNSVAYDSVRTRLLESDAEVEEHINHNASSQGL